MALNTFNRTAAYAAVALVFVIWLAGAIEFGPAYKYSRWFSVVQVPMLAFGLYIYFTPAFYFARRTFTWLRAAQLTAWLLLGCVVPYLVSYGLALFFIMLGALLPELTYVPFGLRLFENALTAAAFGMIGALVYSLVTTIRSYRASANTAKPAP